MNEIIESRVAAMQRLVANYQKDIDALRHDGKSIEVQHASIAEANRVIRNCAYDFKLSHWSSFVK